jgi:response regulator RpfG family c-di-GMP phosphodiesterase
LKESQDIIRERNTANDRIRELQNHMEEKDRKSATKVKRVEDQLDELTRELALSRKQVSDLMDDHRTLTSKRDAELRESQIKIQKLVHVNLF